jgi:hypothetical protein
MMKFATNFFVFCLFVLFFTSCDTTNTEKDATLLTIEQLRFTPGYEWYDLEYQSYTPNPVTIAQIKNVLMTKDFNYYIYVNPSCACTGTQKQFPSIMKVLIESGVSQNKFEIYSMLKTSYNHPYKNRLRINDLPAFFVVKDSIPLISVIDTLAIRKGNNANYEPRIEDLFLELITNL